MDKLCAFDKVVKSNALIEACHKLSVQEQKVLLLAISKIPKDSKPTDDVLYSIRAKDLSDLNGQSLKNCYVELKSSAISLMDKRVHIHDLPNGGGKLNKSLVTCWVQSVFYVEDEGRVELRFSKDILPYVCQLKQQFTLYKIKNIGMMSSSYGIRLYELLSQYLSIGKRELHIDWLKQSFGLSHKYPAVKDFKKWVLEPAVSDVNAVSDMWVKWEQRKSGRKVTHFVFTFSLKAEEKPQRKRVRSKKINVHDEKFLAENARPGETREQAIRRLKELHNI